MWLTREEVEREKSQILRKIFAFTGVVLIILVLNLR